MPISESVKIAISNKVRHNMKQHYWNQYLQERELERNLLRLWWNIRHNKTGSGKQKVKEQLSKLKEMRNFKDWYVKKINA